MFQFLALVDILFSVIVGEKDVVQTSENNHEPIIHKKTSIMWSDVVREVKPDGKLPKDELLKNKKSSKGQNCSKMSVLKLS